jgi:hypothetical protein
MFSIPSGPISHSPSESKLTMSSAVLWSPNKSLLRSDGQWYLVCKAQAGLDKLSTISLGEPPGAELSR